MLFCCTLLFATLKFDRLWACPFLNPHRAPRRRCRARRRAREERSSSTSSKRHARTVAAHVPATHGVAAAGSRAEHAVSVAAPGERGPHQRHDDVDAGGVGQVRQLLADHRGRGRLRHTGRREGRARRCGRREARATSLGDIDHGLRRCSSMVKLQSGQCPSSAPVPPQGAPGGSGQLGTPRKRPARWAPSHCLGRSS